MRDAQTEHLDEPPDKADAYALLDDGEIRAGYCPSCCGWTCSCDDWERPARERQRQPAPRLVTDR